jgi:hypothetical protein
MTKILTLTNEQAITLYNVLSGQQVDRIENRARWKFLEVIEEAVLKYEEEMKVMGDKARVLNDDKEQSQSDKIRLVTLINADAKKLSKISQDFRFKDREVFAKAKDIFEKADKLEGTQSKLYFEVENAFIDVREEDVDTKQKK